MNRNQDLFHLAPCEVSDFLKVLLVIIFLLYLGDNFGVPVLLAILLPIVHHLDLFVDKGELGVRLLVQILEILSLLLDDLDNIQSFSSLLRHKFSMFVNHFKQISEELAIV